MLIQRSDPVRLPSALVAACRRWNVLPTRHVLIVRCRTQTMLWLVQARAQKAKAARILPNRKAGPVAGLINTPLKWLAAFPRYQARGRFRISTSRFGLGQIAGSQRTPLSLHRVADKIGGGWPIGTVFQARRPIGFTWLGLPNASIVHRILWLEGLEPGLNRGGNVDSYRRYIYVHGFSDETTLGRPASCGCIHLAAADLLPLFQQIPLGTLLWICE